MRLGRLRRRVAQVAARIRHGRWWKHKTLVVGPEQPVDGDSLSCTKALIRFLRRLGLEAYTLPIKTCAPQLQWILEQTDLHPSCPHGPMLTTTDLQLAYDTTTAAWRPDELVMVDGQRDRLGFDSRGILDYVIDHHPKNVGCSDDSRTCVRQAPSTGCILMDRYGIVDPLLAVSILSDTNWLRHSLPADAIRYLNLLRRHGLTNQLLLSYNQKLRGRRDPEVIRALRAATVWEGGEAIFVIMKDGRPEVQWGVLGLLISCFRHLCVVRGDGWASFRTDPERPLNIIALATAYGGGGRDHMAACSVSNEQIVRLLADFKALVGEGD